MPVPDKAIRLTSTLRNNRLLTLRQERGLSQRVLAKAIDVDVSSIGLLESFCTQRDARGHGPSLATPRIRCAAERLAIFFAVPPEELIPPDLYEAITLSRVEREISQDDAMAFVTTSIDDREALDLVGEASGLDAVEFAGQSSGEIRQLLARTVTPREEQILRLLFGIDEETHSTQQVAVRFRLSRSRVHQITTTALGKIQRRLGIAVADAPPVNQCMQDWGGSVGWRCRSAASMEVDQKAYCKFHGRGLKWRHRLPALYRPGAGHQCEGRTQKSQARCRLGAGYEWRGHWYCLTHIYLELETRHGK